MCLFCVCGERTKHGKNDETEREQEGVRKRPTMQFPPRSPGQTSPYLAIDISNKDIDSVLIGTRKGDGHGGQPHQEAQKVNTGWAVGAPIIKREAEEASSRGWRVFIGGTKNEGNKRSSRGTHS